MTGHPRTAGDASTLQNNPVWSRSVFMHPGARSTFVRAADRDRIAIADECCEEIIIRSWSGVSPVACLRGGAIVCVCCRRRFGVVAPNLRPRARSTLLLLSRAAVNAGSASRLGSGRGRTAPSGDRAARARARVGWEGKREGISRNYRLPLSIMMSTVPHPQIAHPRKPDRSDLAAQ